MCISSFNNNYIISSSLIYTLPYIQIYMYTSVQYRRRSCQVPNTLTGVHFALINLSSQQTLLYETQYTCTCMHKYIRIIMYCIYMYVDLLLTTCFIFSIIGLSQVYIYIIQQQDLQLMSVVVLILVIGSQKLMAMISDTLLLMKLLH